MSHNRRYVNVGSGVTRAVDLMAGDFSLHEMTIIVIREDVELESRSQRLEADEVGMPLVVAGVERSVDDVSGTSRREEALMSQPTSDASLSADERGKHVAHDADDSRSDVDTVGLKMMDGGFTQLEMRLEGSTRIIVVPMDRDLLKNTEDVVLALSPLYS